MAQICDPPSQFELVTPPDSDVLLWSKALLNEVNNLCSSKRPGMGQIAILAWCRYSSWTESVFEVALKLLIRNTQVNVGNTKELELT